MGHLSSCSPQVETEASPRIAQRSSGSHADEVGNQEL